MLYKQPGSKYYWCKFQWNGETIRRPTKATDKKTARKVESKIRSELALENYSILQPKAKLALSEFLKKKFSSLLQTDVQRVSQDSSVLTPRGCPSALIRLGKAASG